MQKALQLALQQRNQQGVSDRVVTLSWAEAGWGGVEKEDWYRERWVPFQEGIRGRPAERRYLSIRGQE